MPEEPTAAAPDRSWLTRWMPRRRPTAVGAAAAVVADAGTGVVGLERSLLDLLAHSGCGVLLCDAEGSVLACTPVAASLLGWPADAAVGRHIQRAPGEVAAAPLPLVPVPGRHEPLLLRADGALCAAEMTVVPSADGPPGATLVMLRDITERRQVQQRMNQLANFDSLTGLPNRVLFRDRLSMAMQRARSSGRPMALMFLDLDNFKLVNDSLGHAAGDELLRHVAQQLRNCLRADDHAEPLITDSKRLVSRLGGDEFTVIAQDVGTPDDVALMAQRILDTLERPFRVGGTEVHTSVSIGISMYPGGSGEPADLDGLIQHTDMAMYRSKLRGRGVFSFYSDDLGNEAAARAATEHALRRAIDRGEFELHYQPKADLASGEVTGVEALLRWRCPQRGLVAPDRFIGVLEDSGLIVPIGAWAVRRVCADLAAWDAMRLPPLVAAINLSARQFRQPQLAQLIEDCLRQEGLGPQRLEVEITESLLLEDNGATRGLLEALARLGVRVAMDDFGTGHSSLSYLKRFDIDTLKIDRSFVAGLPHDGENAAIASAIVAMGRELRMKVVAEGVENAAQADFLKRLGCHEMQGYLLGRPMPAKVFAHWLRDRRYDRASSERRRRSYDDDCPVTQFQMDPEMDPEMDTEMDRG